MVVATIQQTGHDDLRAVPLANFGWVRGTVQHTPCCPVRTIANNMR
jgi:hypothetical protein